MFETVVSFLGGRVAEQLRMGDISTGASNDLQRATGIVRDMVAKYGMSDALGPVSYASGGEVFIGRDYEKTKSYSEKIAGSIDDEVEMVMRKAYSECERILTEHQSQLDAVAAYLLEHENMTRAQFEAVMEGRAIPDGDVAKIEDFSEFRRRNRINYQKCPPQGGHFFGASMYYNALSPYLKARFGGKVYKLALSSGCSCPNRDGLILLEDGSRNFGGCTFCTGSGEFAASSLATIPGTAGTGKIYSRRKGAKRPVHRLFSGEHEHLRPRLPAGAAVPRGNGAGGRRRPLGRNAAGLPAARTCLAMLARLRAVKPVWVELGLQTIHEATAARFRRGYPLSVFDEAVRDLHTIGIEVIVHLILGLPGETAADMEASARYVGRCGAEGVKLHLLHILRGTPMAAEYAAGRVRTLELDEYITLLERCLEVLPPEVVIHRLTGDAPKRDLIAPLWSADKKRVLNAIRQRFESDDLIQGSKL